MQHNHTKQKLNRYNDSFRKARTRTMIQLGGLVDKAGLTSMFEIEPGDDLQSDIHELDKAAALLGFLADAYDSHINVQSKYGDWLKTGQRLLKTPIPEK